MPIHPCDGFLTITSISDTNAGTIRSIPKLVVIAVPGTLTLEYLAWNSRWDFLLEEGISHWKKEFLYVKLLEDFFFADFVRCFCGIAMVN